MIYLLSAWKLLISTLKNVREINILALVSNGGYQYRMFTDNNVGKKIQHFYRNNKMHFYFCTNSIYLGHNNFPLIKT